MTRGPRLIVSLMLATAAGAIALCGNDRLTSASGPWMTTAEAVIGRPLTPLSYAGVARRTTRRAVAAGVAMGAAAAPVYVVPGPTCVQVVNAYGQLYWRCP